LLGKAALPDDLPFVTGTAGWLGMAASNQMLAECDTLLMVGSDFPYTEYLPEKAQARGVQIDISPRMLGLRYPMEVNLTGYTRETLRALLPLLNEQPDRSWRESIEGNKRDWLAELDRRAGLDADPINLERIFYELNKRLPDDVILTGDSGSSTVW